MGLVGTLTAELFLMPDGRLVINELAPRVHNSGHWSIEGAATSQFEQHIRAICGLALGSTEALAPTAMVNLLGAGPLRDARLDPASLGAALGDPAVHLHLYDKRRVFERRKMGHLTVTGTTVEAALDRARTGSPSCAGLTRRNWRRARDDRGEGRAKRAVGPIVGVVGGSRSDFPTLQAAIDVLTELDVPAELRVVSAHRTPDACSAMPRRRRVAASRFIVAGAGGAAHLPGMLASKTLLPVIGVPIVTQHLAGMDSLLSIVQMPRGIPVATVAIGNGLNAGLLAAQILALGDAGLATRLAAWRAAQTQAVLDDPSNTGA